MNFDNLILNDLMTRLYQFIPSLLILIHHIALLNAWKNLKSISGWSKSVKGENRDLCKTPW